MLTHRSNPYSVNLSKYCSPCKVAPGGGFVFLFLSEPQTRKGSTLRILFRGMWVQLHTRSSAHNGLFLTDRPPSFWTVTVPDPSSAPLSTSTSPSLQHVTGHAWEWRTPPPLTVTEIRWRAAGRDTHNKTKTKTKEKEKKLWRNVLYYLTTDRVRIKQNSWKNHKNMQRTFIRSRITFSLSGCRQEKGAALMSAVI